MRKDASKESRRLQDRYARQSASSKEETRKETCNAESQGNREYWRWEEHAGQAEEALME
jgi:hypothetical protein